MGHAVGCNEGQGQHGSRTRARLKVRHGPRVGCWTAVLVHSFCIIKHKETEKKMLQLLVQRCMGDLLSIFAAERAAELSERCKQELSLS